MPRHLLMRLSSPLIAFGGETIDNYGVIRDFPALSMVTGLVANALGWDRADDVRHNRLQARLKVGTRLEAGGTQLTDFQTAQLGAADRGWTTWGRVEERRGNPQGYESPHLRYRDYHADRTALLAVRLDPADEDPTLEQIAAALPEDKRTLIVELADNHARHVWMQQEGAYHVGLAIGRKLRLKPRT